MRNNGSEFSCMEEASINSLCAEVSEEMREIMINIRKLEAELWESADLLRAVSKLTSTQYCTKHDK